MTFLPTYLQYVHGVSATSSGLRTLPMVVGLFAASITAGTIVGRTGRYKVFPIAGSLLMTVGLLLMSTMDATTGFLRISANMFVLGVGIGLCMQILTIIVQNTSDYRDLGVATSGVTFFRALGSSFGAAVFGAVYSGKLESVLGPALASSGLSPAQASSPEALHSQPAAVIAPVVNAYADVLQSVFLYAAPVGVLAFVLSLFLPEVPLRDAARAGATAVGEGFGMAENADSDRALEIQLARLMQREGRRALPAIRIASGTALGGAETWCVAQVLIRERRDTPADLDTIAQRTNVPASVLLPAFRQTQEAGYLTGDADGWQATGVAREEWAVFSTALKAWLLERLGTSPDAVPADGAMLDDALRRMIDQVLSEEASSALRPPDHALAG
jgi:MFS family permease